MDSPTSPVFVHSLFRAGSTYLFSVFRRSSGGYWCYQEPLNERLPMIGRRPGGFEVGIEGASNMLRHPELDKPHCYEFHAAADQVLALYREDFAYHQYFVSDVNALAGLRAYLEALGRGARGRPLFQCCRTAGRVGVLRQMFSGVHLFLWRHPWDQWWSYKNSDYFSSRNLFIADAQPLPSFLSVLKQEMNLPTFERVAPEAKHAFLTNRHLPPEHSYLLFYGLWCHAMLEAGGASDLSINIDALSTSQAYRDKTLSALTALGVGGLDFSDCAVPATLYGKEDADFFRPLEQHIHELLRASGYQAERVATLQDLSEERLAAVRDTSRPECGAVRDAMRARVHALQVEKALSDMQSQLFSTRGQLQQVQMQLVQAQRPAHSRQ